MRGPGEISAFFIFLPISTMPFRHKIELHTINTQCLYCLCIQYFVSVRIIMVSKFPSPAQDYAVNRISLDAMCNSGKSSVYLVRAQGGAIAVGIHPDAILVIDRSLNAVHGSVILVSVGGEYVIRRLCLYPVHGLEYMDGSGNITIVDEEDFGDDRTVEVFGVVTYALNDMRTSEFDDLVV